MAKRKLNRRQAWRIRKIQEERCARAGRKTQALHARLGDSAPGPEQSGLLIANFGASVLVEGGDAPPCRCLLRQNLEPLVVGDRVVWQAGPNNTGVVVARSPRQTLLARPDADGTLRPLAANIDQILVVIAPEPPYSTDLIDQYLVAAEQTGIPPVVVLNKVDLLEERARRQVERELHRYETLGYPVLYASTHADHGLEALHAALCDRISVFVGQSGVGKSSLINTLLPAADARVGALSEQSGFGRHTTSTARLYHLPGGGALIDSPGVRDFRLWDMTPEEIAEGFVELRPYLGHCRFRDCRHTVEPGCALREAAAAGRIEPERLASYHRIVATLARG